MRTIHRGSAALACLVALAFACSDDETDVGAALSTDRDEATPPPSSVTEPEPAPTPPSGPTPSTPGPSESKLLLSFTDLPALDNGFTYEGWVIVDGQPISTGKLPAGTPTTATSPITGAAAKRVSAFVLTIEPANDVDPGPTKTHVLAGLLTNGRAELSIAAPEAIGTDFSAAAGTFILATPTDGSMMTNETSGVWFLVPPAMPTGMPRASLELAPLPEGWTYEGWAVADGKPLSTGKFTTPAGADRAAPFSAMAAAGPPFPGEDFLVNAPSELMFPLDLRGKEIVITVEPEPDDSAMPYPLKPLSGRVPIDAMRGMSLSLDNTASKQPRGTAVLVESK